MTKSEAINLISVIMDAFSTRDEDGNLHCQVGFTPDGHDQNLLRRINRIVYLWGMMEDGKAQKEQSFASMQAIADLLQPPF